MQLPSWILFAMFSRIATYGIALVERHLYTEVLCYNAVSQVGSLAAKSTCLPRHIGQVAKNTESRTALLWWNYFQSVEILKKFLRAERLGDWKLHLDSVRAMEPLFHATAHHNYAKWTRHYVQAMNP